MILFCVHPVRTKKLLWYIFLIVYFYLDNDFKFNIPQASFFLIFFLLSPLILKSTARIGKRSGAGVVSNSCRTAVNNCTLWQCHTENTSGPLSYLQSLAQTCSTKLTISHLHLLEQLQLPVEQNALLSLSLACPATGGGSAGHRRCGVCEYCICHSLSPSWGSSISSKQTQKNQLYFF